MMLELENIIEAIRENKDMILPTILVGGVVLTSTATVAAALVKEYMPKNKEYKQKNDQNYLTEQDFSELNNSTLYKDSKNPEDY